MTRAGRWALLVAALGAFAPASRAARPAISGIVTHVSDGDTLWVRPDGGRRPPVKLRVVGIDAPETCQAWGAQSRAALQGRVLHRPVHVAMRGRDAHGRLLGALRAGNGEDMGAWMVAHGHAWSQRWRSDAGPYAAHERQARSARRGLFADAHAEPPRQFRQRHGPCDAGTSGTGKARRIG